MYIFLPPQTVYFQLSDSILNQPLKEARDVKDIGHYSSGKTEIITEADEIPYAISLIKQAYEKS